MLCSAVQDSWFISFFSKNYFCRLSWGMNIRFWVLKVTNSLHKIYWKPMAKEKHNYHMFYFKNTLYTGNLNSGLKGTDFTCTQCMINNKNLECFTFSLIFQFFVWVPLKGHPHMDWPKTKHSRFLLLIMHCVHVKLVLFGLEFRFSV